MQNKVADLLHNMIVDVATLVQTQTLTDEVKRNELCEHCCEQTARFCAACHGRRTIERNYRFAVDCGSGTRSGDQITIARQGHQAPGMIHGDIVVNVTEDADSLYRVRGWDLYRTQCVDITCIEATIGFSRTLTGYDGRPFEVIHRGNSIIEDGEVMELPGVGLPNKSAGWRRGSVFVKIHVTPTQKYGERVGVQAQKILIIQPDLVPLEAHNGDFLFNDDVTRYENSKMEALNYKR